MLDFPGTPSKLAVSVAAVCLGLQWSYIAVTMLIFAGGTAAVVAGMLPMQVSVSPLTLHIFVISLALFMVCGAIALVTAYRLRCPHCGYNFLKNPKGLGPAGFIYNPNCPKRKGINPWAIQVCRFLVRQKIRCIKCGEEVFNQTTAAGFGE